MSKRLLVLAVGMVVAALLAAKGPVMPWPRWHAPKVAMPVPNAFDDYRRAAALVTPAKPDDQPYDDAAVRRRILADNAVALRTLRAGFAHVYLDPPEDLAAFGGNYYGKWHDLVRALTYEAAEHAAAGRYAAAIDSQLDALRFATDIERGAPTLPFANGMQATARQEKRVVARIERLDAQQAAAAARRLEGILAAEPVPADTLRMDRVQVPALWAEIRRDRVAADGLLAGLHARLYEPRMIREHDRWLAALIAWAETGSRGDKPAASSPDPKRLGISDEVASYGPFMCLNLWWINRAGNELFLAALALQAWRAEHGAYPETLEALVPSLLAEPPRDPFGNATLKYRHEGERYVLYSVGPDRVDDGGRAVSADEQGKPTRRVSRRSVGDYVWGVSLP